MGATVDVIQKVKQTSQGGVQIDSLGTIIYISPRVMKGLFAQIYLLDDPFNNFPNFELIHNEPSLLVENLRNQNVKVNDFVYYQDMRGPIKIWKINYTGKEEIKQEYLDTDPSKYLSWRL